MSPGLQAAALRALFAGVPDPRRAGRARSPSRSRSSAARSISSPPRASTGAGALFAVGGGVVGDLAGFAAATYLRGIDYYQVPTTLLAMVDSSVGGKTGVNLKAGKNLAGAFHQPRRVFIATGFLGTLPAREFAAGTAEVIKSALLADRPLFEALENAPLAAGDRRLPPTIRRCCAIKARLVEADERERADEGGRALLNLGHTFAHAVEQVAGYGSYLHGEAVAVGLCAAARLSSRLGMIGAADAARVESAVSAHGLPTRLRRALADRRPHGGHGARQEGARGHRALRAPRVPGQRRRPGGRRRARRSSRSGARWGAPERREKIRVFRRAPR